MTTRLPAVRRLADELRASRTGVGKTVAEVEVFIFERRSELQRFETSEGLTLAAYGDDGQPFDAGARALAAHLQELRNAVLDELWSRQIFIGVEVLDDLLFWAARQDERGAPVLAVLEFLRDRRANRPGIVVFGLHSLGVVGGGLVRGARRLHFEHAGWGMAISPQTNSLDRSIAFIEDARESLGVRKRVDPDLLAHWHRSRAEWLVTNPLLVVKMVTQRGSYYDAEWPVTVRVRATTAFVAMVAIFQPEPVDGVATLLDSSRTNNWETLDIHHYLVLYDHPGVPSRLEGDAVPIHRRGAGLAELSELNVRLDPTWRGRRRAVLGEIELAVNAALSGMLRHRSGRAGHAAKRRTYTRAFDSLDYFRRSFARGGSTWAATVSLATAFEMLLTDHYAGGVQDTLARRTGLLLAGMRGRRAYEQAVRDIYKARSDIVHAGSRDLEVDLRAAQQAYTLAFARLVPRIERLSDRSPAPIAELTGDR